MSLSSRPGRQVAVAVVPALAAAVLAATFQSYGQSTRDYLWAVEAGRHILGGGFDVYVQMPYVQMGPLPLVLTVTPWWLFMAAICSLLAVTLGGVAFTYGTTRAALARTAAGGLLLAGPWVWFGLWGHLDDVLVIVGFVVLILGRHRDREWWAAAGFVLAIAAKPTAVLFLPLVFVASRRAGVVAVAASAAVWAPFVLPDVGAFLAAGSGIQQVNPGSLPHLLGYPTGSAYPLWIRPVELVACWTACWLLRRDFPAAIVVVFVIRAAIEPGAHPGYVTSAMAAGLFLDARAGRRVPVTALLGAGAFLAAWNPPMTALNAALRLGFLFALAAVVAGPSHQYSAEPGVRAVRIVSRRSGV